MGARKTNPESDLTPGRPRRRLFVAAAILLGLAPPVLLEGALRISGVGRPAERPDASAGFDGNFPLFERVDATFRTSRSRAPFLAEQSFPAAKPAQGYRIFCFGGSTVYGHPYLGDTAFPKWLELELTARDPSRAWQAINCGGISYASYRIAPLVREVVSYQPDLVIVGTGHNEFLEDRTYQALKARSATWSWVQARLHSLHLMTLARRWLAPQKPAALAGAELESRLGPGVSTRLDYQSGYASYRRDPAWHRDVLALYEESVRDMVRTCQAARVPVILVRLGSNLRDCPPFKSEHRAGLTPEEESDWQAAFDIAAGAEKTDPRRALEYYREAAKIDDRHALLHYRIARVLDRAGRHDEALTAYERARDEDICPLRIMAPFEEVLARIAAETRTPLVDAATLLAARSADRIPGFDWYVDHVHPTIPGHQHIARALADQLHASGILPPGAAWSESQRRDAYTRHLAALGPGYIADGERRLGWLEKWAQRQRLAAEVAPQDAAGFARLAFRRLDLAEDDKARGAIQEALRRDPEAGGLLERHASHLEDAGLPAPARLLRTGRETPSARERQ